MEDLAHLKDLLLIAMTGSVSLYIGTQIKELVRSVNLLNIKIAEILIHLGEHADRLSALEKKHKGD